MDRGAVDDRKPGVLSVKGEDEVRTGKEDRLGASLADHCLACVKEDVTLLIRAHTTSCQGDVGVMNSTQGMWVRCNHLHPAERVVKLGHHHNTGPEECHGPVLAG